MRIALQLGVATVLTALLPGCQAASPTPPPAATEYRSDVTIREIMKSMVAPQADVLWNSVSTNVTATGVEEKAPQNDKEWQAVRSNAVTILEATNAILMPGRHVAKPGEKAEEPSVQLSPEQIEALIAKDPANWTKFAHGLYDATAVALQAIDAKDTMALLNAGDGIDTACENCHKQYWYPNEGQADQK